MFTHGFKTAAFDHNNQGLEFKMSDQGQPNVGPGGMAPSGIPSYQPYEKGDGLSKKKGKRSLREVTQIIQKISAADIAPTTVSQLKWTFEQDAETPEQTSDRLAEEKNRRKAYIKARLR